MAKRKYYSVILIILLISVMALAQEVTTSSDSDKVNKSGDTMTGTLVLPTMQSSGILLFTNISFNFQQLKARYWAFGHPTDLWVSDTVNFSFFTDINLNGNEIIGCANCGTADNEKMNKSGDTMTGKLSVNLSVSDTNNSFEFYSGEILRSNLNYQGFQNWYFNVSNTSRGRVAYAQSANRPGIALYGNDGLNRSQFLQKAGGGFEFGFTNGSTAPTADITFDVNGNISSVAYAGTGNAYICVDSSGNYYRGTPTC